MAKCALCPWTGHPAMLSDHIEEVHLDTYLVLERGLREMDEDIKAAQRQAGYSVDEDISSAELDDEDLSDA